jgi:predicted RND superfamily exporter protein
MLSAAVRRRPLVVVVATLLGSLVLANFAGQAVRDDQVSVETARSAALEIIDERFGDRTSVLQVLVRSHREVRSADGLQTSIAIQQAISDSNLADTLVDGQQPPPIISYLAGAEMLLDQQQRSADEVTDAEVLELAERAAEQLPGDVARLLDQLTADADPAHTGLILVFQDTDGLDDAQQREQQAALARVVSDVDTPDGITVEPFSFGLLFGRDGNVGAEVARLFGAALVAVLLLLALVYWRSTTGRRGARLRRTAADVGLTLTVVALAVVWMQGFGVLLGPDYLGLVGYFSPSSQIVPILVVGLGVDFAIHLLARYRDERRGGANAGQAADRAIVTVGVALSLGAVATATGFLTNLASPLDFLAMLGVLAAIGVLGAFVLATTFLPAVRMLLDQRADRRATTDHVFAGSVDVDAPDDVTRTGTSATTPRRSAIASTAWLAERAPVPTLVVAALVAGVGVFGTAQLDSRFDVTDFVSRDEPMLDSYQTLTEEFAGGFDGQVEILLTGDLLDPDAHNALVDIHDHLTNLDTLESGVGGVTSPVSAVQQARNDGELADELAARGVDTDGTVIASTDLHDLYRQLLEHGTADDIIDLRSDQPVGRITIDTPVPPGREQDVLSELDTILAPLAAHGIDATATSQELIEHQLTE